MGGGEKKGKKERRVSSVRPFSASLPLCQAEKKKKREKEKGERDCCMARNVGRPLFASPMSLPFDCGGREGEGRLAVNHSHHDYGLRLLKRKEREGRPPVDQRLPDSVALAVVVVKGKKGSGRRTGNGAGQEGGEKRERDGNPRAVRRAIAEKKRKRRKEGRDPDQPTAQRPSPWSVPLARKREKERGKGSGYGRRNVGDLGSHRSS